MLGNGTQPTDVRKCIYERVAGSMKGDAARTSPPPVEGKKCLLTSPFIEPVDRATAQRGHFNGEKLVPN